MKVPAHKYGLVAACYCIGWAGAAALTAYLWGF